VYGDHPRLPKIEAELGNLLSPYAATKLGNEIFANVFHRCYGLEVIGLRYFNVFGPRQDPEGPYAAVIPKWIDALLRGENIHINGDGKTSRDFCFVANVVQANLLAAAHAATPALGRAFNVALNERTTLNELFLLLREMLAAERPALARVEPEYGPFRTGDVEHSQADISLAQEHLGFAPTHSIRPGLEASLAWYLAHARP
jgi:UDP-N-acetylglucosamine 4-epimerase